ncbi:signal peptidase I [Arthrobacter sp. NPDC057013]|uniref:signal peptidase I n=1 Tax=Arthrobacter sp. NPDC057013 TaxID=3345999 RepID=UPI0036317503
MTAATGAPASGTANPAVPAAGALRTVGRVVVSTVTTVLMVVALAAFLFLAVGPRFLGYQTSTMLTGSMAPLINPGDVVVSVPSPVGSLKAGDIITYKIPVEDRRVETHRIVELKRNSNGTTTVRTKGDANNGADPWQATIQGDTVDVQAATVPYLGTVIRSLREPAVLMVLTYAAPGILVLMLLARIWRKGPDTVKGSRDGADGAPAQAAARVR